MGDFLKSAMNYFTPVSTGGAENDFVGNIVEVQSLKLRIKRLIAEGEYTHKNMYSIEKNFMINIKEHLLEICVYVKCY